MGDSPQVAGGEMCSVRLSVCFAGVVHGGVPDCQRVPCEMAVYRTVKAGARSRGKGSRAIERGRRCELWRLSCDREGRGGERSRGEGEGSEKRLIQKSSSCLKEKGKVSDQPNRGGERSREGEWSEKRVI
ncbi:hypothetical protein L1049_022693 [Liquidambar formosana]|uniref:Uncharacterized protein n=1 Tax=Liquidambar formosana TaxID=63359 RepID=A0AAP0REX5_LIQFO